jgi:hypothetical protein
MWTPPSSVPSSCSPLRTRRSRWTLTPWSVRMMALLYSRSGIGESSPDSPVSTVGRAISCVSASRLPLAPLATPASAPCALITIWLVTLPSLTVCPGQQRLVSLSVLCRKIFLNLLLAISRGLRRLPRCRGLLVSRIGMLLLVLAPSVVRQVRRCPRLLFFFPSSPLPLVFRSLRRLWWRPPYQALP